MLLLFYTRGGSSFASRADYDDDVFLCDDDVFLCDDNDDEASEEAASEEAASEEPSLFEILNITNEMKLEIKMIIKMKMQII